jgi:hypothetical protein
MGAFWDKATILKFSRLRVFYGHDFGLADTVGNGKDIVATLVGGLLAVGILFAGVRLPGNRVVLRPASHEDGPVSEAQPALSGASR